MKITGVQDAIRAAGIKPKVSLREQRRAQEALSAVERMGEIANAPYRVTSPDGSQSFVIPYYLMEWAKPQPNFHGWTWEKVTEL